MKYKMMNPACRMMICFGSRWALTVLLALHEHGPIRFGELRRAVSDVISERMLAATLDELVKLGLVSRTVFAEVPPRVEYATAPKTVTLIPIIYELRSWAEQNC